MIRIVPWKILAKYGANAYKVDLPSDLRLSHVFNVANLTLYKGLIPPILHEDPNLG